MRVVRSAVLDRRHLRVLDDSEHLGRLRRHARHHAGFGHEFEGLFVFLLVLVLLLACYLVSGAQDQTSLHGEGLHCAGCVSNSVGSASRSVGLTNHSGFAFFGWVVNRAGGLGPIIHQPATIGGSKLAWAFVSGVMSSIANFSTLIVNDPDFSRFAGKPRDQLWSQLITIPCGFAFTSFIGIIVSSSSTIIYKEPIWNPLHLLGRFLDAGGAGNRAGVFFIATAFSLAQLGTNIAANSVSAGTDMTALLPRYLDIRRGGYVCAAIGLAMCPWNLLSDNNKFTTYLSAYSVFLSSIAGVMISDYYFVRKGYLEVKNLYSAKKNGPYYFQYGIHWRAYVAYIAGILINVVGFVGAVATEVPIGATYIYNVNFFAGFIVSSGTYYLLSRFFPIPACSDKWMEVGEDISEVWLAYDDASENYDDSETRKPPAQDGEGYPATKC